jgi:hypothetical protein
MACIDKNRYEIQEQKSSGMVYRPISSTVSEYNCIKLSCRIRTVAIHVADQASKLQVTLMLAEGTMLHGLSHKNVLSVIAANVDNLKQPLLVYPYSNKGNLKR